MCRYLKWQPCITMIAGTWLPICSRYLAAIRRSFSNLLAKMQHSSQRLFSSGRKALPVLPSRYCALLSCSPCDMQACCACLELETDADLVSTVFCCVYAHLVVKLSKHLLTLLSGEFGLHMVLVGVPSSARQGICHEAKDILRYTLHATIFGRTVAWMPAFMRGCVKRMLSVH